MEKPALKSALFTLAAALVLAGCAQSGASSAAPPAAASSAPEASAPSQSAAPKPESTPAPSSAAIQVSPDAGQTWPPEGDPFDPFPDGPPSLPDETLIPVTQADMDTLLAGKSHASWMYRMEDTNLVYQYRFFPDGYFSASLGKFETDSGVYGHGTCRFLQDGLLEAMVWLPEEGSLPDESDSPVYPVYLTVQLQWPGEGRDVIVATLLTLEDTSPDGLMDRYFRPAVGIPLPMDLYAD